MTGPDSRLIPWPVNPPPEPGEDLRGYVLRLSAFHDIAPLTVLHCAGVISEDHARAVPTGYGFWLAPRQLANFAHAIRQPPQTVRSMLISGLDGLALDLGGLDPARPDAAARAALANWVYTNRHRACPKCLEEAPGVVRLHWRLPWVFACTRHAVLLADDCPACRKPLGRARSDGSLAPGFAAQPHRLGTCNNSHAAVSGRRGRASRPCGHDLTTLEAPDVSGHGWLLGAQALVDRALAGEPVALAGETSAPLELFRDLRSLCALMRFCARPEDLANLPDSFRADFAGWCDRRDRLREEHRGKEGPSSSAAKEAPYAAAEVAALTAKSLEILTAPSPGELTERLGWLYRRAEERLTNRTRQVEGYFDLSPRLARAVAELRFARSTSFRRRMAVGAAPARRDAYDFGPEHVPQLFWSGAYREQFAPLLVGSDMTELAARQAVSVSLAMLCGGLSRDRAAEALGLKPSAGRGVANKLVTELGRLGAARAFADRLHEAAEALATDPRKADFGAVRFVFAAPPGLDEWLWREICAEAGVHPGKPGGRSRLARVWAWSYLNQSAWMVCPLMDEGRRDSNLEVYYQFRDRVLPGLEDGLAGWADGLMRARGLAPHVGAGFRALR